ncbi:beta-lactamase family protein [Rhodoblastus acidophilus]|uniref:Beta-lactamase family protein n=1 Tax=Candidatus Rhodoblastus alkanivorans TaxID=2954117 RepID=A0ABS9Z6G1_9HYPH|nr:serine hydrolase [Candidatus Rhodoblastus alkanivorans]MCI4679678.1 beta-lactamase family protein [Candidatus Rhodoblastus alkanivorans]MCI4683260.1 beta-lactamase family protein [Candidatus Rhodoblastus alkanivorans]MDI4640572.1 beta-lactamase family protein [Rhodoblastus acidophilus]
MVRVIAAIVIALSAWSPAAAQSGDAAFRPALQQALDNFVATRREPEHISAASLSISLKGAGENINLAAGTTKYPEAGEKVTPADLFEIGSITKSFTSVALLHLEAKGKLTIEDKLGKWLPQYPAWKNVSIHRLLDMTSPIPGYDNQPSIARIMGDDPGHTFTPQKLIAASYPHDGEPKPVSGWTYSNTNYILAEMIIEKAGGKPYAEVVRDLFKQVGLKNTFYEPNLYPASITDRMVSGYFFSHDPDNKLLAPLLGRDVKNDSVSWMQGAGGIVSSMDDVARWARALYEGPLLAEKQRGELMTVVSDKTGKPIAGPSEQNPGAFGLGVGAGYRPALGAYWFYQGMTLGYRVLYGYFPKNGAVIVVGLNSQPDEKQNRNGALLEEIYGLLHKAGKI